ncbi:PEGA domain-containing protein [Myxococcota bacterium]
MMPGPPPRRRQRNRTNIEKARRTAKTNQSKLRPSSSRPRTTGASAAPNARTDKGRERPLRTQGRGTGSQAHTDKGQGRPVSQQPVAMGRLTLQAVPWGNVYIQGKLVGPTPLIDHPVPAGSLKVRLVNPVHGVTATQTIDIPPGGRIKRTIHLRP